MVRKNLMTLQVFRGIAALIVVLYHSTEIFKEEYSKVYLYGLFSQGFSGVDFFFILSGFIIFYIHHTDIAKKDKFKIFITKRFIRVYPIHWIATSLMFIAFIVSGLGESLVRDVEVIIASYILLPSQSHINSVTWTLSHEMLFYFLFSTLLIFNKKFSYPLLTTWIALTLINFLGIVEFESFIMNFLFSAFNIEFALGVLSAYLVMNYKINLRNSILAIGILLLAVSWYILYQEIFELNRIIAYGVPFTIIIIGAASISYNRDIKTPRFFNYLGEASYSIYLIHFLFIETFIELFSILNFSDTIGYFLTMNLIVILTVIMSCLFYQFVEKPILKIMQGKVQSRKNKSAEVI